MPALVLWKLTGQQGAQEEVGPAEDGEDTAAAGPRCRPEQGWPPCALRGKQTASRGLEKEHSLQRGGPTTLTDTGCMCLLSTSSYQNVTQGQQKCLNSPLPAYPREHPAHGRQLSRKDNAEGKLREILDVVIFLPPRLGAPTPHSLVSFL